MTDKAKLDKMKKLADAMYYAAQSLTTDASKLLKAMEEYHKFIIYEYNKQEPASEELEKESDIMATNLFKEFFPQDGDMITPNDFCKGLRSFARLFADRQKEQMIKNALPAVVKEGKRVKNTYVITSYVLFDGKYTKDSRIKMIVIPSDNKND